MLTPLLHAVWKPDPASRDQVRMSLTRSYKSPTLQNLVARPSLSSRYPASGANTATSPDRAGNPDLRPELATGLDIAFERYLLRRFYSADPILSLLVTFGLAMVAEQAIRMIWGAAPLPASMRSSRRR